MLPKDREEEKSNVNWWIAAIDQSVRLFIEKTAAGTRIINTVSVLRINHKEINLFYSALFCSSPWQSKWYGFTVNKHLTGFKPK